MSEYETYGKPTMERKLGSNGPFRRIYNTYDHIEHPPQLRISYYLLLILVLYLYIDIIGFLFYIVHVHAIIHHSILSFTDNSFIVTLLIALVHTICRLLLIPPR